MIHALSIFADVATGFVVLAAAAGVVALWVLTVRAAYRRGHGNGLDHVLAVPAEGDHFTEALLSGALHKPVSEEWAGLLDRIQEHERAAKETAR